MKATILIITLLTGAAALMPVEIATEPDAGLDAGSAPVDVGVDPAQVEAQAEAAKAEAQSRVEAGAPIEVVFAELRHELARLDSLLAHMDVPRERR